MNSQVASVGECPLAYSGSVIAVGEGVVWLPPAQLLSRGRDAVLLLNRGGAGLPPLVQLLVLAVFLEVIEIVLLLEDSGEAKGIYLCFSLFVDCLLDDIFFLEVMEVGVLAF